MKNEGGSRERTEKIEGVTLEETRRSFGSDEVKALLPVFFTPKTERLYACRFIKSY